MIKISEEKVFNFLKERQGLLEGCVICGGEPTVHNDLPDFIAGIKKLGYSVKLDTNGSNPEMLEYLIDDKLVDYVAMDIKSSQDKYLFYTGGRASAEVVKKSVNLLKENKVPFEFRTTIAPGLTVKDILEIADWVGGPHVNYFLQEFISDKEILDPEILKQTLLKEKEILSTIETIKGKFKNSKLR